MDWLLTATMSAATGAWITHAGLRSDVDRLRALLPRAHALIDRAEQCRFTNAGVADLLFQLKDATYDADDLVDELTGQERQASDKPFSSLCIFVRELVVGTAHKVRDIHARLDLVTAELERAIEALDMQHKPMLLHRSRETSSFLGGNLVLGRDREHEELVHLLLDSDDVCRRDGDSKNAKRQKKCEGVAVLPIVGIGGVGKTTLAQVVYNDQRVQDHFHLRMWVCMPESLDVTRLTKEIIESATKGASQQSSLANLDTLQGIVKDLVVSRRFFLVLDDAWSVDVHEWQRLCAPLKNGLAGSVVLVTTRSQKVADAVGTMDPLCLRGLPDEAYWDLFKQYTFGEQDIAHHPELEVIGKKIISKLKGSPLAAKTVSGMLRSDMSTRHWRTIMNSELWELEEQGEGDILPALQLSYQYLPAHLKRCFAFCSIFPKGYTFQKQTLIDMWIAQGFMEPRDSIGNQCWKELLSRSFFQQHMFSDISCSMHDLMCDLSQAISIDECAQLDSKKWQQTISYTVRHVSVYAAYQEPSTFLDIGRFTKLRSLVIFDMFEQDLSYLLDNLFRRLTNLRLLVLRKCMIKELPKSIGYLKHLRYLDVSSTKIRRLPDSALQLSKLQVLNIQNLSLDNHPKCMSRLTNLRKCYMDGPITSLLANLSNLTSLQNSMLFDVPEGQGQRIAELKNMTQLIEVLHIRNLENVTRKFDAAQAMLNRKEHLRELILEWSSGRLKDANSTMTETFTENMVLEFLQPHPNLEHLKLKSYSGGKSPSWLQTEMLHCLRELRLSNCLYLTTITSLPSSLQSLHIENCTNLTSLEECLQTHSLKRINQLRIINCAKLSLLPVERFHGFGSLCGLDVQKCPKLPRTRKLALHPSIESLFLKSCGYLDGSLPDCLCDLSSLTFLGLYNCPNVRILPKVVVSQLRKLKGIFVYNCDGLLSLGGLNYLSLLIDLHIVNCPRLTDLDQSMVPNIDEGQGMQKLEFLNISSTSLLRLVTRDPIRTLQTLVICQSGDSVIAQGVHTLPHCFPSLEEIVIENCRNLQELPEELHSLSCLQFLRISNCPKIQSLPVKGLPSSLERLTFENCHPVLVEQLEKLQISYNTGLRL